MGLAKDSKPLFKFEGTMCKIKSIIIVAAALFVSASVFAAKAPDWVVSGGMSKAYPSAKFFSAVGEGITKDESEVKAVQGLVSVFGQSIKSTTVASKRMSQAEKDGKISTESASSLSSNVLRQVNQDAVIGVEIVDYYQDATKKWYALAVMDKPKVSEIYKEMINKNYAEIASLLQSAKSEPVSFDGFARLDFAVEIAKKTTAYFERFRIINPEMAKAVEKAEYGVVEVQKALKAYVVQIPVCVKVSDDSDGRIRKAFEDALASRGLNTSKQASERYVIDCDVQFVDSTSSNGKTFFCEYTLTASISDSSIQEEIIPLSFNGREGGNSAQNASTRAKNKIASRIKETFTAQLNQYLDSFTY